MNFISAQLAFLCIIPHTHFFSYIGIFSLSLMGIYLLCSLYTLLWICFRRLRKLSSLLVIYKRMLREQKKNAPADSEWDKEKLEKHMDVYGGLNSPDVELLLDLLAETMGLAQAMRIMTMLDPDLLSSWKVERNTEVYVGFLAF